MDFNLSPMDCFTILTVLGGGYLTFRFRSVTEKAKEDKSEALTARTEMEERLSKARDELEARLCATIKENETKRYDNDREIFRELNKHGNRVTRVETALELKLGIDPHHED